MWFLEKLLGWLLPGLFKQVGESVTKGIDDKRDDQAHEDLGAATERAQNAQIGQQVSDAMAEAQATAGQDGAAETALAQGTFLLSPAKPARKAVKRSVKAMNKKKVRRK